MTGPAYTPAEVARLGLIIGVTDPKKVRWLCSSRAIECTWNGVDGNGARYWLTRAQCDAYNHRHTVRPRIGRAA